MQVPWKDQLCSEEAVEYLKKNGMSKEHEVVVVEQESTASGYYLGVLLVEEGEEDLSSSLNAYMLAEGLAKLDTESELPEDIQEWKEFEDEA